MLKRQIEAIEVDQKKVNTRKYYQTVNRFTKGFQPRLNACKDNNGKLIQGDDKILEHWVGYFKTLYEREDSGEESEEEVFPTVEPLVEEPSWEEIKKAICNLKTDSTWRGHYSTTN
jgi:hypothetical protein